MSSGGVPAALSNVPPSRSALDLFSLTNRVAMITGGHRGIGLEIALAFAEAGAIVYCIDLPDTPDGNWLKVQKFAGDLPGEPKGRLEYASADVTNQKTIWAVAQDIGNKEGRLDICVCSAGILRHADCLEYPAEEFQELMRVNVDGVLFSAQAAGRQMKHFNSPGSIILIASMSGTITNPHQPWVAYNTSKSAVLQMARSMACELGPAKIRVNTISPGYIYTDMTRAFLEPQPELMKLWQAQNPLGRLGAPGELRGVALWLASDASSFCTGSDIIVDGGQTAW
ncbi:NAD(P)-binding protein [Hymenopellis radicata]|nr:NAD(P)-binding protein [Hymenopellis radicata]